jgi:adenine phosphoribosyltransferase
VPTAPGEVPCASAWEIKLEPSATDLARIGLRMQTGWATLDASGHRHHQRVAAMPIKSRIRTVPHYPKEGVMFRDITTLLKDPVGFRSTINELVSRYEGVKIDKVVGIESRGFIVGSALAFQLGLGFVPIRKKGKLPAETVGHDYELEYGKDRIEIHLDAISKGDRVLLADDLIATGGTAEAAVKLIESMGGTIVECCFIIDLPDLGGRKRLESRGQQVFALCEFEGD